MPKDLAMHAIHYKYTDIDGQRLFYREAGPPGAPALLLLHGFPASSFMFRDLIPLLAVWGRNDEIFTPKARSRSPTMRPPARSATSTVATSCSKATSTPWRAPSAGSSKGDCRDWIAERPDCAGHRARQWARPRRS